MILGGLPPSPGETSEISRLGGGAFSFPLDGERDRETQRAQTHTHIGDSRKSALLSRASTGP